MTRETFINIIIVFLITVVFGYLLGITITNVVDQRLSDISINMPKITLPRQNIYVHLDGNPNGKRLSQISRTNVNVRNEFKPDFDNEGPSYALSAPAAKVKPLKAPATLQEGFTSSGAAITPTGTVSESESDEDLKMTHSVYQKDFSQPKNPTMKVTDDQVASTEPNWIQTGPATAGLAIDSTDQTKADCRKCKSNQKPVEPSESVRCTKDSDCNVVFGDGENRCLSDGKCYCVKGSGQFCHYGPCYYKDPKDMTDRQVEKFKNKAKFSKMTVQDYVNWLGLFADDLDKLALRHVNNFVKLRKGGRLTIKDIPRDLQPPPMTAQDYFTQLYTVDNQINLYTPQLSDTTGLQIPANYSDYSQFTAPQNLKHLLANKDRPVYDKALDYDKNNNQDVLRLMEPHFSNDWQDAMGTSTSSSSAINKGDRNNVEHLATQISGTHTYNSN